MSEEDLNAVRASIEQFNRTGYLREESLDPEIEIFNLRESPLPGPYRGHEGARRWSEDIREVMSEARFDIEEMVEVPEASAVVTRLRLRGRALHTGLDVDLPMTLVSHQRDGRTVRSEGFSDHGEALRSVGG